MTLAESEDGELLIESEEIVDPANELPAHEKHLTFLHGLGLVIGLQIGSGIWSSPNQVSTLTGSVGASLLVWVAGGLIAWTGAVSYAELGSALPVNGGTQAYLLKMYGDWAAFIFTMAITFVLKPGSLAIISLVGGEYAARGLGFDASSVIATKALALCGLAAAFALSVFGRTLGATASTVFLVMKFILLAFVACLAIYSQLHNDFETSFSKPLFEGSATTFGPYAAAVYNGLWAFDGWDNLNFVSAEMRNAQRDLPRVIHSCMPAVTLAYLLANISYFAVLTIVEIDEATSVTLTLAAKVAGATGKALASVLIAASCFGALNASLFSAGRVLESAGTHGLLPSIFAQKHSIWHTPHYSLAFETCLAAIFIVSGQFHTLTTLYGSVGYMFYLAAVVGLLILRKRHPELERPYKAPIVLPIVFALVTISLLVQTLLSNPLKIAVPLVFFIICGVGRTYWPGRSSDIQST